MTPIDLQPVVMAGGSGTRLWPLSRAQFPKQFLVLQGDRSLFQQAAQRLASLAAPDIHVAPTCVVGNEEHRFLVLEQLREIQIGGATLLLEPMGRNTAPAMTLAALQALDSGADPVLAVTPADQTVVDERAFTAALQRGGMAPDMPAAIIQGASTAGELVVESSLARLAEDATREGIGAPAIVVIGKIAGLRQGLLSSMVGWQ